MSDVLFVFEIIGTVAFAVSGAVLGIRKEMDILGITFLGITTGVGGGIIRDLLVGVTPPLTFRDPIYILIAFATSVFVFLPPVRRYIFRSGSFYEHAMLLMDAIGLGTFTVSGIRSAISTADIHGVVLLCFIGVVTGAGGGVLRDVLAGDRPYIFIKHFYASASLIGALCCILLWEPLGEPAAMTSGAALVILLRLCAAKFRWSLPKADLSELDKEEETHRY